IDESLDENFLSEDKTKEKLNQIRIDRINSLQTLIQPKTKIPKRPRIPDDPILRQLNNADSKRNINGTPELQILYIINQYRKILDNDSLKKFPSLKIKPILDIIKKSYNIKNKYTKKRIEETDALTKELINYLYDEQPRKKANISINRLKKDKTYKQLKTYPLIYRKKKYSPWNLLWMQEEQIDDIQNIELIIDEYKESLFDKLSITKKNINIIQNTLSEMMGYYKTEDEKRNFLELTVEVLVNSNIDVDDIEDDSIRNINEPNINFGHLGINKNYYLYLTFKHQQLDNIPTNFRYEFIEKEIIQKIEKTCYNSKEYFNISKIGTYIIYKDDKIFRKITSHYELA
ncbi:972_t:CDS:2, partial [Scutellospora calospora]